MEERPDFWPPRQRNLTPVQEKEIKGLHEKAVNIAKGFTNSSNLLQYVVGLDKRYSSFKSKKSLYEQFLKQLTVKWCIGNFLTNQEDLDYLNKIPYKAWEEFYQFTESTRGEKPLPIEILDSFQVVAPNDDWVTAIYANLFHKIAENNYPFIKDAFLRIETYFRTSQELQEFARPYVLTKQEVDFLVSLGKETLVLYTQHAEKDNPKDKDTLVDFVNWFKSKHTVEALNQFHEIIKKIAHTALTRLQTPIDDVD